MNILHLSRTMGQGGAEKVVFQLCQDNCNEKQVVASCGGIYVEALAKIGIHHYIIPDMEEKNPIYIYKSIKILHSIIKKEKINIIHTHHRMGALYARILQFFFPQLRHVYTAHNVFYGKKKLMNFALQKSSIVACGKTVKNNLIDEYGVSPSRVSIIYNSVNRPLKTFNPISILNKEIEKGSYLIGSIGRITKQKGFDVFVKAISLVAKKNPHIMGVIVGDGEERTKIESLVEKLAITENIIFLGYQSDVYSVIKQMQFIVLASRWEGFPLISIETFAMGKTIIVSDIPNNLEIVTSGEDGLAFKKDDYEELALQIENLITADKKKFEINALRKYNEKFSYLSFIDNYQKIYSEGIR